MATKKPEPINLFEQPKLKVKLLAKRASLPSYESAGAACFDIASIDTVPLLPGRAHIYSTGLAFEVPPGYVMQLFSRSGMGFSKDTRLANCVGIVDSDYRGEVKVKLRNDGKEVINVRAGDRIAQGMLVKIDQWAFEEVEDLSSTERGEAGLGSTGK